MYYIPENTNTKIYPVAQAMVITLFMMVTILGAFRVVPEINNISHKFNLVTLSAKSLPTRIIIPALGINSPIINPVQADIETLDHALLQGVVRYPRSAMLGTRGNIILFGHSSHLKFVNNKAYQAFNDINTLKVGDEIIVYGDTSKMFKYAVTSVVQVKNTDAGADIRSSVEKLTLITCNNFGSKEDRYIVEAQLLK